MYLSPKMLPTPLVTSWCYGVFCANGTGFTCWTVVSNCCSAHLSFGLRRCALCSTEFIVKWEFSCCRSKLFFSFGAVYCTMKVNNGHSCCYSCKANVLASDHFGCTILVQLCAKWNDWVGSLWACDSNWYQIFFSYHQSVWFIDWCWDVKRFSTNVIKSVFRINYQP